MNTLKNILQSLTRPVLQRLVVADFLLLIPRLACGFMLSAYFGADKFGMPWSPDERDLRLFEVVYWFPQDVAEFGGIFSLLPSFFAWMGAFSEAVGGLLLAIGFQTRIAAFLILCTMLVAIFLQHGDDGMWNMLPGFGFLWVAIYSIVLGSGRFGLDFLLTKNSTNRS
jgi:putative oxidoreductase